MFKRVLVGVDGDGERDAAVLALTLAGAHAAVMYRDLGGERLVPGRMPGACLGALARERAADLVVISAGRAVCGRSVGGLPSGGGRTAGGRGDRPRASMRSVLVFPRLVAVLRSARCPVAIAPPGFALRNEDVVTLGVGFSGSAASAYALAGACRLARERGCEVTVLSVCARHEIPFGGLIPADWLEPESRLLDARLREIPGPRDVRRIAVYGEAPEELAGFSGTVELLSVGWGGAGSRSRPVAASALRCLARHASCPLLVFPAAPVPGEAKPSHASARSRRALERPRRRGYRHDLER
ncbi:MAG: universal stress protein [Solirubrobacteraceae bacterium]